MLSEQRFYHPFHPYQSMSQISSSSLPCRVHQFSPMKSMVSSRTKITRQEASHPRRNVEKELRKITLDHSACPAAISNSSQAPRDEPFAASAVAPGLPSTWNTPQYPISHSFSLAPPPATCPSDSLSFHCSTDGPFPVLQQTSCPVHASTGTQGLSKTIERSFNSTSASSISHRPVSPSLRNIQDHRDIVSYLKAWRPPVEYYARRRYQHPSLSYPSRRPSLPSLLEERITNDGNMNVVCPQSVMSTSPRAYRRKIFPPLSYTQPVSQHMSAQGWSDESEEDLESDESDDDENEESDDDLEAVTPTTSPVSSTPYFLQPLVLTKLPGYP